MRDPLIVDALHGPRFSRAQVIQVAALAALIFWRLCFYPLPSAWRDWLLIVSAYSLFTVLGEKLRLWPVVTVATMAYLLVTYLARHFPLMLSIFRSG